MLVDRVNEANPNIEVTGTFKNSQTKIECRCRVCGNEWESLPSNIMAGHGCKRCRDIGTSERCRLTTEQYKNKIKDKNPDIEVLGEYKTAKDTILVRCTKCGREWEPNAFSFSKRARCIKCDPVSFRSHEEFVSAVEVFGKVKVVGQYINTARKVQVQCVTCGKLWDANPSQLLNGSGCEQCMNAINFEKKRFTHDEFIRRVTPVLNPDVKIIGEYTGYESKIKCHCNQCDNEWETTPVVLFRGSGCPRCTGHIKSHDDYINEIRKAHPTIKIIGKYRSFNDLIECECETCGTKWSAIAGTLKNRLGCPECKKEIITELHTKPHEHFLEELKSLSPTITILNKYSHSHQYVTCQCRECGFVWEALPTNLLKGSGCPKCFHKRPKNERCVDDILRLNKIDFIIRKTFDDLFGIGGKNLSYDFYIPKYNLLIEVQGEQHYMPIEIFGGQAKFEYQQEHDRRKREYAKTHGYTLLEIKYDEDVFMKLNTVLNLESVTTTGAA